MFLVGRSLLVPNLKTDPVPNISVRPKGSSLRSEHIWPQQDLYLFFFQWGQVCLQLALPRVIFQSVGSHMPLATCSVHDIQALERTLHSLWFTHWFTQVSKINQVSMWWDQLSLWMSYQLKEVCRLSHRLGCWVREVRERAALPLRWWGNPAGEKIRTALWGHTTCSLSNTWRWRVK